MSRITLPYVAAVAVVLCAAAAEAQELNWAQQLFEKQTLDFGVVARGADVTYRLKLTNNFKQNVHIANVRTGCQCVHAALAKDTLVAGEASHIQITIDTRRFTRERNSSVIVTFDAPLFQEVTIPVHVYIRTDVVLTPGSAEFGSVPQGTEQERRISVSYAGRPDWTIKNVVTKNEHISLKYSETSRGGGRVDYEIVVGLKSDTPVGDVREQVRIISDDQNSPEIPFLVEARIEPEITVTPEQVSLGILVPGQTKTVNVVFRGRKPFTIQKIESESGSDAYQVRIPAKPGLIHVLPLIVTAPAQAGPISEEFTVTVSGVNQPIRFKVSGKIVPGNAAGP